MDTASNLPAKNRRRWRRWAWWGFALINVAGLILILPLLKAVYPLVGIWRHTHSQASFRTHQQGLNNSPTPAPSATASTAPSAAASAPAPVIDPNLSKLTSQLTVVQNVSTADLSKIVAAQFGPRKHAPSDPKKFDDNSAVFDTISSTNIILNGRLIYCYQVDLVDLNGNHEVFIEGYTEPNLDYERSKATMELIHRTPELKKVYDAMAYVLAEKSNTATNHSPDPSSPEPAPRLEKEPDPK